MRRSFLTLKSYSSWARYTVAVLCALTAALVTLCFSLILYPNVLTLFFVAIIISAWFGGFKPGALTTALSAVMILYITPGGWIDSGAAIIHLITFVLVSLLISWLIGAFYKGVAAVSERETWFQEIFEGSRDAIFLVEESTNFVECNRAACELTGYSREELLSMRIPDLHDESDLQAFRSYFHSIMGGKDVVSEALLRRKDGVKVLVEFSNRRMMFRGNVVMHTTARDIVERRRVEERLQKSERQLASAQQIAHIGSWEWDIAANRVSWSEELYRIFGLKPQEFGATYEAYHELVHPYDKEFIQDVISNALRDHQPVDYYHRIIRPDGTARTLHVLGEVIVDENGVATKMIGTAQDVTERKMVEARLCESEDRYRDLVEHSHVLICTHDLTGRILSVNQTAVNVLGYDQETLLTKNIKDCLSPEFGDQFDDYIAEIQKKGVARGVMSVQTKSGEKRIWEYNNTLRTEGVTEPIVRGVAHDVTEQRRAEYALKASEAELRKLFAAMTDVILVLDAEGHYLKIAPTDPSYLYKPPADLIGKSLHEVFPKEEGDFFLAHVRRALAEGRMHRVEYSLQLGEKRVWFDGSVSPLSKGSVVWIARDVTERKRAEEDLRQQKEILQKIFDHIPAMVAFIDNTGAIKLVNNEWERVLGWSREESYTCDVIAELYPDLQYRRSVLDFISSSTGEWRDFKTRIHSGKVLETSWANVKLMDGTSIGIGQDVTERKHVEKAREQLLKDRKQLLSRLVKVQEDERRRIARELHDQLGQQITALMLGIKWLKDSGHCQPQATKHLDRLQEYADQLGREVHHIAWELRPTALDDLGLHTALGNYLEKWSEGSGKRVELHSNGFNGHRLSAQIETTLYRVIQEALTNVLKHSEAEFVSLILERRNNHVLAIIEDDGRGFNVEAVMNASESEHKLGLLGMRERLALVFGTLDIESTPGAGTSLFVRIPTPQIESECVIQ
jgi:PAS domain S-box-containing protein